MSDTRPLFFVSLDLETSGTDHDLSVPIQVGLATGIYEGNSRDAMIGGWDWDQYEWSAQAEKVHNIPKEYVDGSPKASLVDGMVAYWLWSLLPDHARKNRSFVIPLGWNIASFDMPFVRKHLPILSSMIAYRSLDLNSVCFFLGGENGWREIKMKAKDGGYAVLREAGGIPVEDYHTFAHDAGFDAMHAMASYFWLRGEYVIPF